jgi:hypothetical protein
VASRVIAGKFFDGLRALTLMPGLVRAACIMRHRLAILAAILAVAFFLYGVLAAPYATAQENPTPTSVSQPTPSAEVIALRAQLEEMRRGEDRLLQAVLGGIAVAITVLAVVNVVGYAFVNRNYQQDKETIRQELLGVVAQNAGQTELASSALISAALAENAQRITQFEQQTSRNMGDQIREFSETARSSWEGAATEIKARLYAIEEVVERNQQQAVDAVERASRKARHDIVVLEYEVNEMKYKSGGESSTYAQYSAAMGMIKNALELEWDYYIARSLSFLVKALKGDRELPADEVAAITELMEKVPGNYSVIVEEIRSLLRKVPSE